MRISLVKSISISEAVNNVGLNLNKLTISWEGYIFKPLTTLSGGTTKILHRDLQFMWWGSRGSKDGIWAEYSLKQGRIIPRVRSGYLYRVGVSMLSDRVYMRNKIGAIKTLPFGSFTGLKCPLNTWERDKSYARSLIHAHNLSVT